MRPDLSFAPAIFAQTVDALQPDALRGMGWPGVLLLAVGGSGGLVALVRYIAQPFAEHLKAKREREAAERAEEQAQRKERHTAELDQIRVVTSLAQSVPATLDKLTTEIKNDRDVLVRELRADREMMRDEMRAGLLQIRDAMVTTTRAVESTTQAVDALAGHLVSEDRDAIAAIAEKVGAQRTSAQRDTGPRSTGARPRLPSSSQ